jgi:aldehyde dehydrogenase (NAD+)
MKTHETTTPVRAFDRAYINGRFVTPHGIQVVDLVNPTDNKVIGKVTMADEIDTRKAIGAAKEAFNTFSPSSGASHPTSSWTTPISPRRSRWPSTPAT